jgi:nucleoside-diphosphate-sugar epimerase
MAETVVSVVGAGTVADAPWPQDDAAVETGDYVGSSAKAARLLGWQATTPLDEGLTRTWDDLSTQLAGSR